MNNNIGILDKTLRILAAIVFTVLFLIGLVPVVIAFVGFMVVDLFVITSLISYCPVYNFFGISTYKKRQVKRIIGKWNEEVNDCQIFLNKELL